jgi:GAF domain-containing protein
MNSDTRVSNEELLKSMNKFYQSLMQCESQEELISKALYEIRKQLDVMTASIYLFNKNGRIQRVGIHGISACNEWIDDRWLPNEEYEPGESFSGAGVPKTGELTFGKSILSNNIEEEYKSLSFGSAYKIKLNGLQGGISVPLNGICRTFGTLEVLNKQKRGVEFSYAEQYWLMLVGTHISSLLTDIIGKKKRGIYDYLLNELVSIDGNKKQVNTKRIYNYVATQLVEDFTPFVCCIVRGLDDNNKLSIKAQTIADGIGLTWEGRSDVSVHGDAKSRIVWEVFSSRRPRFIHNIDSEINRFQNKEWIRSNHLKSFACLPLFVNKKCLGTISIYTRYHHKFSDSNKTLLSQVAFLLASVISRTEITQELKRTLDERNNAQKEILSLRYALRYEHEKDEVVHGAKNDLMSLYHYLERIDNASLKPDERSQLLAEKREWIKSRVEDLDEKLIQKNSAFIDICKTVDYAIGLVHSRFTNQNISYDKDYQAGLPLLDIDDRVLKDIIINLLMNAERAVHEEISSSPKDRQGRILVSIKLIVFKKRDYVEISITDNGDGISNEHRDDIFKRGFTTRIYGTGIGLYTVKTALDQIKGQISFKSKIGHGTTFTILIPA